MILAIGAAAAVSAHKNETVPWTTSTVYATSVYTITSCAATVTNCPEKGQVTTDIISLYTTVCPVTATETTPPKYPTSSPAGYPTSKPAGPETSAYPTHSPAGPESSAPAGYPTSKPAGPETSAYPTHSPAGPILSTMTISTCIPTVITTVVTVTPSPTYAPAPVPTYAPSGVLPKPPTNSTIPFTGGASAKSAGGLLMVVGLAAALL